MSGTVATGRPGGPCSRRTINNTDRTATNATSPSCGASSEGIPWEAEKIAQHPPDRLCWSRRDREGRSARSRAVASFGGRLIMLTVTSLTRGVVVACCGGFATAAIPLVASAVALPHDDPFDRIVTYLFWWGALGLLVGRLARRDPAYTWRWAAGGELGFLCGVVFAVAVGLRLGEPMNLWPLTLLWSFLVSTPAVIVGGLLGRRRGATLGGSSASE